MQNTNEQQLINYLENQITDANGFIEREARSIEVLTSGDDKFTEFVDEVVQSKFDDIRAYKFRVMWLQSQLNQINETK